jgi:hypothetical protein
MALERQTIERCYDLFHQHIIIEPIRLTCRLSGCSNFDSVLLKGVMMSYGFVYVMANESMPKLYKIGYTKHSPMQRAVELSKSTGVASQYDLVCYGEISQPYDFEQFLHKAFDRNRLNQYREFFKFETNEIFHVSKIIKEHCDNFVSCDVLNEIEYKLQEKGQDNG